MESLGPEALAYVERVRRATSRLGDSSADEVQSAIVAVRDAAHFDVNVPTSSARREVELLKTGVKKLSVWYMRYMAAQFEALGGNLVRLGEALSARTDGLDQRAEALNQRADELDVRLVAVEERLRRYETQGNSAGPVPAQPGTVAKSHAEARAAGVAGARVATGRGRDAKKAPEAGHGQGAGRAAAARSVGSARAGKKPSREPRREPAREPRHEPAGERRGGGAGGPDRAGGADRAPGADHADHADRADGAGAPEGGGGAGRGPANES